MSSTSTVFGNVMLDLETMGTKAYSPIVAIGAVQFDLKTDTIGETFYQRIDLQSCEDVGLKLTANTVLWWLKQSDLARGEIVNPSLERCAIQDALLDFAFWIPNDAKLWGNGSNFDNVILSSAYEVCNMKQPWDYWNDRCYRTVKSLKPSIEIERLGTHHNALDDAISQAKHLQKILGVSK
jgi:hypothetical protein